MSKKVVTLLNKYGPMLSGELARKFEHEYGASNTAARQALSRAKKPVNKICTLSFDKNQKFFYLESQYMSNRYIERLMDAIKQSSQINWVYICAFQSQNGFVAKSILPSLVSSPIKNVKGHKLHQRVIDDLLKCGIIVEYNETHWMLAEWASIQNRSIARAVGLETVKKQVVNDFASWAQNINLIGYDSAKVLSASAEFANFQWALTAPAYIQPLYDTEKIRPGFVVADIFYGRTATEEDINFFLDKLSVIRTFKKLPAFMPVFLVENITREALMILKENKVMVALIKNVFDEKYAELLAEIVSVFSHSSAIISKNPEKIETLFSEIAKAEGRYNDIIGDMFELLVGYYYQHIGYRYLKDKNRQLIVTTMQKMANAVKRPQYEKVMDAYKDEKVVFIIDECHRSQFGDMHKDIVRHFRKAQFFGFTGTPRFEVNGKTEGKITQTTEMLFGECLHNYLIKDAIFDNNVLGFHIEYIKTMEGDFDWDDPTLADAIDIGELYMSDERMSLIANHIIQNHKAKTRNGQYTAIFAVSSIDALVKYYDIFKKIKHDLNISGIF